MTFKDLLEQFSFDEIAPAFKTLWQRNAPEQAAGLAKNLSFDTGDKTGAFPLLYPFGVSLGGLHTNGGHELFCLCKRRQCTMLSPLESLTLGRKCRYGNRNRGRRKNRSERVGCRIALGNHILWRYGGDVE